MAMAKENMTIEDLAKKIDNSDKKNDEKFTHLETSIEDLARITKNGFDEMGQLINTVDKRVNGVQSDIKELKRGQEDIRLKLDNVAYRFELVELQRRVTLLEKKLG